MTAAHVLELGFPTLQSRVERWESDFNRHWNVRFYGRSFQMAAEVVAVRATGRNPGAGTTVSRHIRFHKELFVTAPVAIRSARVASGPFEGAVVHVLSSAGTLAACALDRPGAGGAALPAIAADLLDAALPRGITGKVDPGPNAQAADHLAQLGPVRPAELDHTGGLLAEEVLRRVGIASHDYFSELGFSPAYVEASRISRMLVELRTTTHATPEVGSLLQVRSRLTGVSPRTFTALHRLERPDGTAVTTVEQVLVAVDLASRKAVDVPAFLGRVPVAG